MGLPLALFGSSVLRTMQALSLCCEPNGWLGKGAEMLHWPVSEAQHLYSGQGATPLRQGPASMPCLQDPFPALIFPRTGLPQRTPQGIAVPAAQRLGLDKEEIQSLSKTEFTVPINLQAALGLFFCVLSVGARPGAGLLLLQPLRGQRLLLDLLSAKCPSRFCFK